MNSFPFSSGVIDFLRRYPHFTKIISAKFFSIMAGRMLFTMMGWEIYKLTKDPLSIGLLGLCEVIPAIVLSLFAGNIIDIHSRKKIANIVAIGNIGATLTLCGLLFLLDTSFWKYVFYGFSIMVGILRSFWGSTLSAMVPNIIPKDEIPTAGPYSTGSFLFGSIIGHTLGGILISIFTSPQVAIVGILLFVTCMSCVWTLPDHHKKGSVQNRNAIQNIKEGIVYVYSNKIIFSALLLDLIAVLFGGVFALLPIYAKDILQISPKLFGLLNASMDIGAGIGIVWMTFFPMRKNQGKRMIASVFGFGVCIIIFGLSRNTLLSFLMLGIAGFFDSLSMVVRGVILQSHVPDHIRGRVMSVNSIFVASSNELGQFESGFFSKLIGVIPATIFGGIVTIISAATAYAYSPSLRKLEWNKKN